MSWRKRSGSGFCSMRDKSGSENCSVLKNE